MAGGRVKMKGLGRDLTSALSSDHGGERDLRRKLDALDTAKDNVEVLKLI